MLLTVLIIKKKLFWKWFSLEGSENWAFCFKDWSKHQIQRSHHNITNSIVMSKWPIIAKGNTFKRIKWLLTDIYFVFLLDSLMCDDARGDRDWNLYKCIQTYITVIPLSNLISSVFMVWHLKVKCQQQLLRLNGNTDLFHDKNFYFLHDVSSELAFFCILSCILLTARCLN